MSKVGESGECQIKACVTCNIRMPLTSEYFPVRKDSTTGFRGQCRECRSRYTKKWRENNRDKIKKWEEDNKEHIREYQRQYDKVYYQENKEHIRRLGNKHYHENKEQYRKNSKKWRERNKGYMSEYHKSWREENLEYVLNYGRKYHAENKDYLNEQTRLWRQNNRDRDSFYSKKRAELIKNLENDMTIEEWEEVIRSYGYKCAYCGMSQEEHQTEYNQVLHQDHVVPITKGGGFTKDNIVPACIVCNASKGNKDLDVWLEELGKQKEESIIC